MKFVLLLLLPFYIYASEMAKPMLEEENNIRVEINKYCENKNYTSKEELESCIDLEVFSMEFLYLTLSLAQGESEYNYAVAFSVCDKFLKESKDFDKNWLFTNNCIQSKVKEIEKVQKELKNNSLAEN